MKINNIITLALFELKRVWNNKAIIGMVVVAPIMSVTVTGFTAYKAPEGIHTTVFVDHPKSVAVVTEIEQIIDQISDYRREDGSKPFNIVVEQNSRKDALQRLGTGKTRAVVIFNQSQAGLEGIEVIIDITENDVTNELSQILVNILSQNSNTIAVKQLSAYLVEHRDLDPASAALEAKQVITPFDISFETSAWKDLRYFDFYASAMIAILTFIISLNHSLIAVSSERSRGTIERIFVTPFSKTEFLAGKLLAYALFAIIVAFMLVATLKIVFNLALGNLGLLLLVSCLVGINGVVFGLLISSITYTEAESLFLGTLCVFAIMGLMTYMVPWETMHIGARFVSKILPYTYGIQAMRYINMAGAGIQIVWPTLVILVVGIIVQMGIAIPVLRREIR